jgi:hypothetical protein
MESPALLRRCRALLPIAAAGMLTACQTPPAPDTFMERYPTADCQDRIRGKISISAETIPLPVSDVLAHTQLALGTRGVLVRRLVISTTANDLDRRFHISESKLLIRALGGTFIAALRLSTPYSSIEADDSQVGKILRSAESGEESVSLETNPGEIRITRDEKGPLNPIQTIIIDIALLPGDRAVEDSVVKIDALWSAPGRPIAPEKVDLTLVPFRHVAADQVDARIDLSYTLQGGPNRFVCSATTSTTLASHEVTRQALWDLGIVEAFSGRQKILALYSKKLGPVRAIFGSPTEAAAVASWIRETSASHIGLFALGLIAFDSEDPERKSSFVPLQDTEKASLIVGPSGEQ